MPSETPWTRVLNGTDSHPLLAVRGLSTRFATDRGLVHAVEDVSFEVRAGEAIGLVGESGSGKSTVLRSLLRLIKPPGQVVSGEVMFHGRDLLRLREEELRAVRGGQISLIFQDPVNVFNPSLTIGDQLRRMLRLHRRKPPAGGFDREIVRILARVGVDASGRMNAYAFNFSQGQLQRIMIAAACMAGTPSLLLADEPTTSLDVTIEAQVLQLLRDLRQELGLALILVTHNLALVAELCDRILVMYGGRIVEVGDVFSVFETPKHPYTRQLLQSMPRFPASGERLEPITGVVPDLVSLASGCVFAPRCAQYLGEVCENRLPPLLPAGNSGQRAACHLYA